MADQRQYLRIRLQSTDYLMPGTAGFTIEKRESLEVSDGNALVVGWHVTAGGRAPAFSLDAELNPHPRHGWQRAVFLQSGTRRVGLVADELQLLAREDVRPEPFRPLGPPPTAAGPLFNAAWVREGHPPMLVFDPRALVEYLSRLGETA